MGVQLPYILNQHRQIVKKIRMLQYICDIYGYDFHELSFLLRFVHSPAFAYS